MNDRRKSVLMQALGVKNWRSRWSMDFHVLLTLAFRSWGIVAGALTVLMLPLWLGATQQGYYYTFASLLGRERPAAPR